MPCGLLKLPRSPEDAEVKERARLYEAVRLPYTLPALVFLGIDDRPDASASSVPAAVDPHAPKGVPYFALDAGSTDWDVEGGEWGDPRPSASAMSGWEAGVFAQARAVVDWNVRNKVSCPMGDIPLMTQSSFVRRAGTRRTRSGEDGSGVAPRRSSRPSRGKNPARRPRDCRTLPIPEQIQ